MVFLEMKETGSLTNSYLIRIHETVLNQVNKSNKIKEKKRVSIPQSIPSLKTQNPWGVCIFFSTAYSSQDMEATSVSINSRMDKEGVEDI